MELHAYRLILMAKHSCREIELSEKTESQVLIGTERGCLIRYNRELFFGDFVIELHRGKSCWNLRCSDGLYVTQDGVLKLQSLDLQHGTSFRIFSTSGHGFGVDVELFRCNFLMDFQRLEHRYDRVVDLSGVDVLSIGGAGTHIRLDDPLIGKDTIELTRTKDGWRLPSSGMRYGVAFNGSLLTAPATLKDYDFFSLVGHYFFLKDNHLYTASDPACTISLPYRDITESATKLVYPDFNRSTRIQYVLPEDEIEVQQPPPKPNKNKKNLLLSLVPSLFMLGLVIVLRGVMGSGGTFVIYSACSMGIGIVMSIVTFFYDKKEYRKDWSIREQRYNEYISRKKAEITHSRNHELEIMNLIHPDLVDSIAQVDAFGQRIFEKSAQDADFLQVRLGIGTLASHCPVQYNKQEFIDPEDPISMLPEQVEAEFHYIENAPVVAHLVDTNGVGIVGEQSILGEMVKNITLDLAIRHFYNEVRLCYILNDGMVEHYSWLRWLRHTENQITGGRNFLYDEESSKVLLEFLYSELSHREAELKEHDNITFTPHYVVFVLDQSAIAKHPISKYIETSARYGFTFLFFETAEELLPRGCGQIIRLDNAETNGAILESANGSSVQPFRFSSVADDRVAQIVKRLAGIQVEEVALEQALTKNITLFELFNILTPKDLDLESAWKTSQVYKTMAAPIGVRRKNEIVSLDISDKASAHGPHGLVAGTTGSGKSELLQTYVLSMAVRFHPYDVSFVIIDFKGGGMANQFRDLPHLVGAITNIDGREINRSLSSIKAELVRRQTLFSLHDVNHINDYIKLYKKGEAKEPLPHLIMIVDEFAELKAEYPDFMKEIISAARIGRTLGIHLILATQKPSGVVDNQIWSNSKFKLCLKVQSRDDSNEVLHSPLAAEIVEPGRAYFQVGNNEVFELIQSAYSGADLPNESGESRMPCDICSVDLSGKRTLLYTNQNRANSEDIPNQLDALVAYIHDYCEEKQIAHLPGICLPPLPDSIQAADLEAEDATPAGLRIPVGIFDDPERQAQGNYSIDLSDDNTYIVGSTMTGKTTLLQTIAMQLMRRYTPREVNIYIIDCGNMAMKIFEDSKMVGGVALAADEEKVVNLFKLLFRTMGERKNILAQCGLGTFKAYLEAGYTDMPQIVLMIDNMPAFKEYYDNLLDDFLSLSREANSLGISIVATATQTSAMNYRALANFGTRIAFVCNDSGEYSNLFDRCRMEPKDVPGRGLCVIDKRILEFQAALSVQGSKEFERVENTKLLIVKTNSTYGDISAPAIPFVPERLDRKELKSTSPHLFEQPYCIPVGVSFESVQMQMLNLAEIGYFAVTGRGKSGKTNFITNILLSIQERILDNITTAYIFDDARMMLEHCKDYGFVEKYEMDEAEIGNVISSLADAVEYRTQLLRSNKGVPPLEALTGEPLLLLVIENNAVLNFIAKDTKLEAQFEDILNRCAGLKICVVFSNIDNANVAFNAPNVFKMIKNNKKVFVFADASEFKFVDITVQQQKQNSKALKTGDAFMCFDNRVDRMRTVFVQ